MKTDRLEFGRGIKGAFELGMLLKAAGELSLYYSCNKTLPAELRASKALEPQPKLHLTCRNVLQPWGSQPQGQSAVTCSPLAGSAQGVQGHLCTTLDHCTGQFDLSVPMLVKDNFH